MSDLGGLRSTYPCNKSNVWKCGHRPAASAVRIPQAATKGALLATSFVGNTATLFSIGPHN